MDRRRQQVLLGVGQNPRQAMGHECLIGFSASSGHRLVHRECHFSVVPGHPPAVGWRDARRQAYGGVGKPGCRQRAGLRPSERGRRRLALPADPSRGRPATRRVSGGGRDGVRREEEVTLTFRSGGTSLCGQAVTDGLLVDTRRHFHAIQVLDEGLDVRVQPGATLRSVNARLMRYRRKLGPDPASEIACTVGGVVANNSSGMACGVEANSYRTLESLVIVLPSGTVLDTADLDADETLRAVEPELWHTLGGLRKALLADGALVSEVRRQY